MAKRLLKRPILDDFGHILVCVGKRYGFRGAKTSCDLFHSGRSGLLLVHFSECKLALKPQRPKKGPERPLSL